jgi:hypothetical protein
MAALGLCARYGEELRAAASGLWLDEGVVDPAASWGTDAPKAPADDEVPCT